MVDSKIPLIPKNFPKTILKTRFPSASTMQGALHSHHNPLPPKYKLGTIFDDTYDKDLIDEEIELMEREKEL